MLVLVILITGILLSALIIYRLYQIKHDEDKHYKRIKRYEEVIS